MGYSLSHAFGAVFDSPDLIAACVGGNGEAETGPLATSWHSNKFLNPARDGAVPPILHLVGDVIDRVPQLGPRAAYAKQFIRDRLIDHKKYSANTEWTCRKSATGAGSRHGKENEAGGEGGIRTPALKFTRG